MKFSSYKIIFQSRECRIVTCSIVFISVCFNRKFLQVIAIDTIYISGKGKLNRVMTFQCPILNSMDICGRAVVTRLAILHPVADLMPNDAINFAANMRTRTW